VRTQENKAFQSSFGTVVQINVKLLLATGFAAAAYLIWPDSLRGYGWGFLSICLGGAALGLFIEALKAMTSLYRRRKVLGEFMARGKTPKSARLASEEDMRKAGML